MTKDIAGISSRHCHPQLIYDNASGSLAHVSHPCMENSDYRLNQFKYAVISRMSWSADHEHIKFIAHKAAKRILGRRARWSWC